jgi:hypothetical protein
MATLRVAGRCHVATVARVAAKPYEVEGVVIEVIQIGAGMVGAPGTGKIHKVYLLVDLSSTTAADIVAQLAALEGDPGEWRTAPADLQHRDPNVLVLTFVRQ